MIAPKRRTSGKIGELDGRRRMIRKVEGGRERLVRRACVEGSHAPVEPLMAWGITRWGSIAGRVGLVMAWSSRRRYSMVRGALEFIDGLFRSSTRDHRFQGAGLERILHGAPGGRSRSSKVAGCVLPASRTSVRWYRCLRTSLVRCVGLGSAGMAGCTSAVLKKMKI